VWQPGIVCLRSIISISGLGWANGGFRNGGFYNGGFRNGGFGNGW
jgi:hypothetical protein